MIHQITVGLVNLSSFGILYPERLNGSDNYDRATVVIGSLRIEGIRDADDTHILAKSVCKRAPIWVFTLLQRRKRLIANGLGRHQPQHHGSVGPKKAIG